MPLADKLLQWDHTRLSRGLWWGKAPSKPRASRCAGVLSRYAHIKSATKH